VKSLVSKSAVVVLLIVGLIAACSPATPAATQGTVSVRVVDAVSGTVLSGIGIEVCPSTGACSDPSATLQADGSYTFVLPAGSGYTVTFARTGYFTATYRNVAVVGSQTTFLEQLLLIDETRDAPADASGLITNAFTGDPVPSALLQLRAGLNTTTGTVVETATSDGFGDYAFTALPAGYYTAEITAAGFIPAYYSLIVVGGEANADQNFGLAPVGTGTQVRIVLTWGASPSDLDSHLTGPAVGGGRFHVFFANKTSQASGTTYVELDLDDVFSFGPETITIYEQLAGTYRYSVHDFTNAGDDPSTALANSGAQVRVYRGASLVQTFNVPSGGGTLWTVFELTGAAITPINAMSYEDSAGSVTSLGLPAAQKD
jgi:hypothetical protein